MTTERADVGPIFHAAFALLPDRMAGVRAQVLLAAIALQEGRLIHRVQIGGPAHGLWQFERGGGVRGVMRHWSTRQFAIDACAARGVPFLAQDIYDRLVTDDVLACCFARLLLYTDPNPMPEVGDEEGAWRAYIRTWRPGKPHIRTWGGLYADAVAIVKALQA